MENLMCVVGRGSLNRHPFLEYSWHTHHFSQLTKLMEWALNSHLQHPPAKDRQVTPFGTHGTKDEKAEQRQVERLIKGRTSHTTFCSQFKFPVNRIIRRERHVISKALQHTLSQTLVMPNSKIKREIHFLWKLKSFSTHASEAKVPITYYQENAPEQKI